MCWSFFELLLQNQIKKVLQVVDLLNLLNEFAYLVYSTYAQCSHFSQNCFERSISDLVLTYLVKQHTLGLKSVHICVIPFFFTGDMTKWSQIKLNSSFGNICGWQYDWHENKGIRNSSVGWKKEYNLFLIRNIFFCIIFSAIL